MTSPSVSLLRGHALEKRTTMTPNPVECMVCEARCDPIPVDAFESIGPLYECSSCGTAFTRANSADGDSNRCPQCNRFGAKSDDEACPYCEDAGTTKKTCWRCSKCQTIYADKEQAVECCGPKARAKKRKQEAETDRKNREYHEEQERIWAEAPEVARLEDLLTMHPLPERFRHNGKRYDFGNSGGFAGIRSLFVDAEPLQGYAHRLDPNWKEHEPDDRDYVTLWARLCDDGAVRLVHVHYGDGKPSDEETARKKQAP